MPQIYGGEKYLQSIDADIWMRAMLNDARPPDDMYSNKFYHECHQIAEGQFGIDLQRQVTASTAVDICDRICEKGPNPAKI